MAREVATSGRKRRIRMLIRAVLATRARCGQFQAVESAAGGHRRVGGIFGVCTTIWCLAQYDPGANFVRIYPTLGDP